MWVSKRRSRRRGVISKEAKNDKEYKDVAEEKERYWEEKKEKVKGEKNGKQKAEE
jgi:hypothetical protein